VANINSVNVKQGDDVWAKAGKSKRGIHIYISHSSVSPLWEMRGGVWRGGGDAALARM
jgi:hypothetical protein